MTEADLEKVLDACKAVPMSMLQCGPTRSVQERANAAWAELGSRMSFDPTTVQPTGLGNRFFTAVPNETEEHRVARIERETEAKRLREIETLRVEISDRQARIQYLTANDRQHA